MRSLLKPMSSAIRALAYDALNDYIAIGYGGEVSIYSRSTSGPSIEYWDPIEHIPAPRDTKDSLVTSLLFFGVSLDRRHLFVGHARAGYA